MDNNPMSFMGDFGLKTLICMELGLCTHATDANATFLELAPSPKVIINFLVSLD